MNSPRTARPMPEPDAAVLLTPRADARFMWRHPAHVLAMGFGSGLPRFMPGTFGTLMGWWLYQWLLVHIDGWGTPSVMLMVLGVAFAIGIAACDLTGRHLGVPDHGAMVWDEIVAIWLVLALVPATWVWQAAAVVVFRIFDITKPTPIRTFERRFKNGFGVMADDLMAAFYTLLTLAVVKFLLEGAP